MKPHDNRTDCPLFPDPSSEATTLLARIHEANLRRADDMDREAYELARAAEREPNPGARARMLAVVDTLRTAAQVGPRQVQYEARTIYDLRY